MSNIIKKIIAIKILLKSQSTVASDYLGSNAKLSALEAL